MFVWSLLQNCCDIIVTRYCDSLIYMVLLETGSRHYNESMSGEKKQNYNVIYYEFEMKWAGFLTWQFMGRNYGVCSD